MTCGLIVCNGLGGQGSRLRRVVGFVPPALVRKAFPQERA
ncbi:MAG: hypothetical protein RJA55_1890 [Acidobacteriota bacterium]|jgi:hypothetical protein